MVKFMLWDLSTAKTTRPLEKVGTTDVTGTRITVHPDETIFTQGNEFRFDIISERMRELAFLNPEVYY